MVTVEQVKAIIGAPSQNKDAQLQYLINSAEDFAKEYCNIVNVDNLDNTITKMVVEDFNKLGSEGLNSQSFNGVSENYNSDYSAQIYKVLNKYKRIRTL